MSHPSSATSPALDSLTLLEEELGVLGLFCAARAAKAHEKAVEKENEAPDPAPHPRPGTIAVRLARCASQDAATAYERARTDLDARIAAHRALPDAPPLAFVDVANSHHLCPEARMVALIALSHALGASWEEQAYRDCVPVSYGGPTVGDVLAIVAPASEGLKAHFNARRLFWPSSSLMRSHLIVLSEPRSGQGVADGLDLTVMLTLQGLAEVTGIPEARTEGGTPPLVEE